MNHSEIVSFLWGVADLRHLRLGAHEPQGARTEALGPAHFNRYFYRCTPPRPREAIEADIHAIEKDIVRMLAEVTGG